MQSNLRAVTHVTRSSNGYRAQLRTVGPTASGDRVLEEANCEMLADSVAVVIALTVAMPEDRADNDNGSRLTVAGSAHASALFGSLPKPALGVGAGIAFELPALRFELRGAFHLPQSATFADTNLGARFSAFSVAARGCWLASFGALELGPCIGADIQRVRATGFGGDGQLPGQGFSWAPALAAFGRLRLAKSFGVVVAVEGAMPIARPRFVYADLGPLHRASLVAAQLLIAPEVHF
jgi:hypothetical protein